jgi:hypothetical protein
MNEIHYYKNMIKDWFYYNEWERLQLLFPRKLESMYYALIIEHTFYIYISQRRRREQTNTYVLHYRGCAKEQRITFPFLIVWEYITGKY